MPLTYNLGEFRGGRGQWDGRLALPSAWQFHDGEAFSYCEDF
jgi:hypothetical protein